MKAPVMRSGDYTRNNVKRLSFAILLATLVAGILPAMSQHQTSPSIGYQTVRDALSSLRARSDVVVTERDGWILVTERDGNVIWSFVPAQHPAHPAVVRRELTEENGATNINMNCLCEASKSACDQLVADFQIVNDQIRESVKRN